MQYAINTTRGLPFDPRAAHEMRYRIARSSSLDAIIDPAVAQYERERRAAEGRAALHRREMQVVRQRRNGRS